MIDPRPLAYGVEFLRLVRGSGDLGPRLGLRALNGGALRPIVYHLAPTFRSERPQEVTSLDHRPPTCCVYSAFS
jgi:hypothetical protein